MSNEFDKTKLALRYWLLGKEYYTALVAMEFASKYHTGTRRDGTTPEFHHQISIASYIRTLPSVLDMESTLATAFLHDVVEDYKVSLNDIENLVGIKITECVKILTKEKSIPENIYYSNISKCPISSIIKGSDRIHNVQTMNGVFGDDKKKKYIEETIDLVLPMIKLARRTFPEQETAYENIKLVLNSQVDLINYSLEENGLGK